MIDVLLHQVEMSFLIDCPTGASTNLVSAMPSPSATPTIDTPHTDREPDKSTTYIFIGGTHM